MAQVSKIQILIQKMSCLKFFKSLSKLILYLKKMVYVNNLEHINQFKIIFFKIYIKITVIDQIQSSNTIFNL